MLGAAVFTLRRLSPIVNSIREPHIASTGRGQDGERTKVCKISKCVRAKDLQESQILMPNSVRTLTLAPEFLLVKL
jgi:hypothetical protein